MADIDAQAFAPQIRRGKGLISANFRAASEVVPAFIHIARRPKMRDGREHASRALGRCGLHTYMHPEAPFLPLRRLQPDEAMSKPITVSIPHSLGKEEALRRLGPGLTGAAKAFPVLKVDEEIWSGDRLTFRVRALGQSAAGTVDVAEDHVRLEVTLPWLLQKFAEVAQATIRARGKLLLEKK